MYSHLFISEEVPDDEWEKFLNPTSEVRPFVLKHSIYSWRKTYCYNICVDMS